MGACSNARATRSRTGKLGTTWAWTVPFRSVGDGAACRCGIVVVRRKKAGAGWRAGFEAALRGLADLVARLASWPPAHLRAPALLRSPISGCRRKWTDGVGRSTLGGSTLEESGSVTFAAHGRGGCTGTWGKAHENTCRCRMKRRGPCPDAWVRQRDLGTPARPTTHTPPPTRLIGPAPQTLVARKQPAVWAGSLPRRQGTSIWPGGGLLFASHPIKATAG